MEQQCKQDQDKVIIRMPDGMRDEVQAAAKSNKRSANAEIVSRIGMGGKTLRDEFAMAALAAMIANGLAPDEFLTPQRSSYDFDTPEAYAEYRATNGFAAVAYRIADAMLAERAKGGAR